MTSSKDIYFLEESVFFTLCEAHKPQTHSQTKAFRIWHLRNQCVLAVNFSKLGKNGEIRPKMCLIARVL